MQNRAEAKIKGRDIIMANVLDNIFNKETGDNYREALRQLDEAIDEALKARDGG